MADAKAKQDGAIVRRVPTASERFALQVEKQFSAEAGTVREFTEYERTLAQHLFLKIDSTLKELEAKRTSQKQDKAPFTWENVNMRKLAIDAVHRVNLGLDALLPAHIYPIPYFNGKEEKYDLDLRIGYEGELYYKVENAGLKPISIRYELVYETDEFLPLIRDSKNDVESYTHKITNPFKRGKVLGGYAYIEYEVPQNNRLILVSMDDFNKAKGYAKSGDFWGKHQEEMYKKTIIHRAMKYVKPDPKKVNMASYAYVENQNVQVDEVESEISFNANAETIDIEAYSEETGEVVEPPTQPKGSKPEQQAVEQPEF